MPVVEKHPSPPALSRKGRGEKSQEWPTLYVACSRRDGFTSCAASMPIFEEFLSFVGREGVVLPDLRTLRLCHEKRAQHSLSRASPLPSRQRG